MGFSMDEIKRNLQSFFAENTLTIVGSGLSCAEGIPGMDDLAKELIGKVPNYIKANENIVWQNIVSDLKKEKGLEDTLLKHKPDEELEKIIRIITSEFIKKYEKKVINEVISGKRTLRFSNYISKMYIPNNGLPIITTNYDRLIEFSCEIQGIPVDNMFVGRYFGIVDEEKSRWSFYKSSSKLPKTRNIKLEYHKRVKVYKPHGCLSWYRYNDIPISTLYDLEIENLIITPGLNKFRAGYEQPFDIHREKANKAIDAAGKFIIIGYGFNDPHLETHLIAKIKRGIPTLIITKSLSENAKKIVREFNNVLALTFETKNDNKDEGTLYQTKDKQIFIKNKHLWDLGNFIEEVL